MHNLILIIFLFSLSVFASDGFKYESESRRRLMMIHDLSCVKPVGDMEQMRTVMDLRYIARDFNIEAWLDEAISLGCDEEALEKLRADAAMRFGSISGEVIYTRGEKTIILVNGIHWKLIKEKIEIKLDYGISLSTGWRKTKVYE